MTTRNDNMSREELIGAYNSMIREVTERIEALGQKVRNLGKKNSEVEELNSLKLNKHLLEDKLVKLTQSSDEEFQEMRKAFINEIDRIKKSEALR